VKLNAEVATTPVDLAVDKAACQQTHAISEGHMIVGVDASREADALGLNLEVGPQLSIGLKPEFHLLGGGKGGRMEQIEPFAASLSEDGRYRLLIEAVTDYAIYMLDPDGIVTSWNPGARRFKGYEAAEIIGTHFSKFYTEEDQRSGLPARALEIAAREGKFEREGWRVRKDGTRFWAQVVIDPIRSTAGKLTGYAKITRDLTERKTAEESLRASQEQFRLLVQGVVDYAIFMLDPDGMVISWNLGAERIKGYKAGEIIGTHFSQFYTPEDRSDSQPQRALEVARAEGRFEMEGWRVRKDGSRFWASVIIDAIRADDGTLLGFAKVTRDVTAQRDTQRALDQAREALFQSQKLEAIGQLTGGIAHDFNNLLMAIQASLTLLRKWVPDHPKPTSLVENALEATQRGVSLTQRMLAFARRQELKPETVDLLALVRGMTDLLERSLGAGIQIETRFPLSLRPAQADYNQLELALLNLVVNARDAMPDGGTVVITGKQKQVSAGDGLGLTPGHYVCLSVADSGIGMDEATLARATDPFFTTKGVGKGTGLGLPMVLGLADQSGGRLRLTSRLGEGTTAELWLPAADNAKPPTDRRQSILAASEPRTRPLTVLAVDDDTLVLVNMAALLEDMSHTVVEASSAERALQILRGGQSIDLVITDHTMPNMTGLQLAEIIRVEWPTLPVILATGYAELPPSESAPPPRLAKPFGRHELAAAIGQLVGSA
jgi:PAS domain S-box-containing protein